MAVPPEADSAEAGSGKISFDKAKRSDIFPCERWIASARAFEGSPVPSVCICIVNVLIRGWGGGTPENLTCLTFKSSLWTMSATFFHQYFRYPAYSLTLDSMGRTPLKWASWTYVIKKQAFNRKRFDAMSGWRKNLVECGSEQKRYLHIYLV